MKYYSIIKFLLISSICVYGLQARAQQRASEKPLSAFYSKTMQEKMTVARPSQPAQGGDQKRASEKPVSAFYSKTMQEKISTRKTSQPASGSQQRASQKPVSAFYSKTMLEKMNSKQKSNVNTLPAKSRQ